MAIKCPFYLICESILSAHINSFTATIDHRVYCHPPPLPPPPPPRLTQPLPYPKPISNRVVSHTCYVQRSYNCASLPTTLTWFCHTNQKWKYVFCWVNTILFCRPKSSLAVGKTLQKKNLALKEIYTPISQSIHIQYKTTNAPFKYSVYVGSIRITCNIKHTNAPFKYVAHTHGV